MEEKIEMKLNTENNLRSNLERRFGSPLTISSIETFLSSGEPGRLIDHHHCLFIVTDPVGAIEMLAIINAEQLTEASPRQRFIPQSIIHEIRFESETPTSLS